MSNKIPEQRFLVPCEAALTPICIVMHYSLLIGVLHLPQRENNVSILKYLVLFPFDPPDRL